MTTGKTIALTRQTFAGKVMSLLYSMLSFLLRSKHLLFHGCSHHMQWFWSPKKIKSVTVSTVSPSISHEVMGLDTMILVFWMLNFKPVFSLSSFTSIKRLFSSLLSAIRGVSSAYLRLLIFLPAILIPACASSSLAFHIMIPAYKLNKQGDNIQPWCTPFPVWNQSIVLCPVLSVASWPAYRFFRRQVRWSGIPISWRIVQFVVVHTVKGFGTVNKGHSGMDGPYYYTRRGKSEGLFRLKKELLAGNTGKKIWTQRLAMRLLEHSNGMMRAGVHWG